MLKASKLAILSMVIFSLSACSDSLSDQEAGQGFAAMSQALSAGSAGAQSNAMGLITIDYDYSCLEGGSAYFTGSFDDEAEDQNFTFDYKVGFNACTYAGVIMDGDITYKFDVISTETSTTLKYSYVGDLSFSGEVDGDCEMDLYGSLTTSNEGGGDYQYKYSGSICGNDAGTLSGSGSGS